jgi:hypothetical protein
MTWLGAWLWELRELFQTAAVPVSVLALSLHLRKAYRNPAAIVGLGLIASAVIVAFTVIEIDRRDQDLASQLQSPQHLSLDVDSRHCEMHTIMTSQGSITLQICLRDPGRPI